jgi:hypothetical protein
MQALTLLTPIGAKAVQGDFYMAAVVKMMVIFFTFFWDDFYDHPYFSLTPFLTPF